MTENAIEKKKLIDLDSVIISKNPKLYKYIPRFVLNYLKRVIHQDALNELFYEYKDIKGLDFVNVIVKRFNLNLIHKGFDEISTDKKYIFASNHPLGGMESIGLMYIVGQKFPNLRFLVNDVLLQIKNYEPLFVPINKFGSQAKDSVKKIEEAYNSENQILIFPAGLVSRRINGKIQDLKWQKNFIRKSIQHKRDIVPIYIEARNSNFFYNLSSIRRMLGIKANIEMFYLADEAYNKTNATIKYYFGKPIPYTTFDKRFTLDEWASKVREHVYYLHKDSGREFGY
jgi:putative hemolysin